MHDQYLAAGADIVETNTFNANAISLADYDLADLAYEINVTAARIACAAVSAAEQADPSRPRFVAGSVGPTNRTASISPDVSNPGYRAVTFDQLASAYETQVRGLLDGGVDILLVETVFDTLNCKAALFAIDAPFANSAESCRSWFPRRSRTKAAGPFRARLRKLSGTRWPMRGFWR